MKKKKKYSYRKQDSPTTQLKKEIKKINWKLVLQLVISCIVILTIYQTAMYFQFSAIMWIYYALLIISAIAFLYFNKGLNRKTIGRDYLPAEWSDNEKDNYIEKIKKHKEIAKKLLLLIIPLLLTFAFEVIYLFYLDDLLKGLNINFGN